MTKYSDHIDADEQKMQFNLKIGQNWGMTMCHLEKN